MGASDGGPVPGDDAEEDAGPVAAAAFALDATEGCEGGSAVRAWVARASALWAAGARKSAEDALRWAVGDSGRDGTIQMGQSGLPTEAPVLCLEDPLARAGEASAALRLGEALLDSAEGKGEGEDDVANDVLKEASDAFLQCAGTHGWSSAWQGAGRAAAEQEDWAEAEAALCEGNRADDEDGGTWAWLALCSLHARPPREPEAAEALARALRLGLRGDEAGGVL